MAGATTARVTGFPSAWYSFPVESRRPVRREGVVCNGRQFHSPTLSSGLTPFKVHLFPVNPSRKSRNTISGKRCRAALIETKQGSTFAETQKSSADFKLLDTENFRPRTSKPSNVREEKISLPFYSRISNLLLDALENSLRLWVSDGASEVSSKSTNYYIQGNYAPVEEVGPEPVLSVTGHLPQCLNGAFLRLCPNPKFEPVAKHHWFDGDGMVHGLRIKDGKATYACRYVRTSKLKQEEHWGCAKFLRIGDLAGKGGLYGVILQALRQVLGVLDVSNGSGTANTALAYHNGKLLALSETDMPYAIRVLEDGDIETVSRLDYDKKLNHCFTAHPKIDPVTGEMFTFGYEFRYPPYATYRAISNDGVMGDAVPITLSGPAMMHDWAITENYAIIMDCPLHFSPKDMVKKDTFAFSFDKDKPIRFGVLPRYAKDESQMRWFESSNGLLLHTANAWEEGDELILIACRDANPDLQVFTDYEKDKCEAVCRQLWEYRFSLKTGETRERVLGEFHTDFPTINGDYVGRKNRYVYTGIFADASHVSGVAKFDLTLEPQLGKSKLEVAGNIAGVFWHGSGRYGSEPLPVPKNHVKNSDEDDSYLLCGVHDENTGKSEVIVIDAKTFSSDPVAVIQLPSRVPYGFHCLFLTEEELQSQRC